MEIQVERDQNVLTGEELARIRFRRTGRRNWQSVVVVLDEDTDYETVEENADVIVAAYLSGYASGNSL